MEVILIFNETPGIHSLLAIMHFYEGKSNNYISDDGYSNSFCTNSRNLGRRLFLYFHCAPVHFIKLCQIFIYIKWMYTVPLTAKTFDNHSYAIGYPR